MIAFYSNVFKSAMPTGGGYAIAFTQPKAIGFKFIDYLVKVKITVNLLIESSCNPNKPILLLLEVVLVG